MADDVGSGELWRRWGHEWLLWMRAMVRSEGCFVFVLLCIYVNVNAIAK